MGHSTDEKDNFLDEDLGEPDWNNLNEEDKAAIRNMAKIGLDTMNAALSPLLDQELHETLQHTMHVMAQEPLDELAAAIRNFNSKWARLRVKHQEALDMLDDDSKIKEFIDSLTLEDLETIEIEKSTIAELMPYFKEAPRDWATIIEHFEISEAIVLYEYKQAQKQQKKNQTLYKKPKQLKMGNTKLDSAIFNLLPKKVELEKAGTAIRVGAKKSKEDIFVPAQLICEFQGASYDLNIFDKVCNDAVAGVFEAGETHFTAKNIAELLAGRRPAEGLIRDVETTLDRLTRIRIRADLKNHYLSKGYKPEQLGSTVFEKYLLPANKDLAFMQNGKIVSGYRLLEAPPMLSYAKDVGQLLTANTQIMNIPELKNNSRETVSLKAYLMRRVEQARNINNNMSNTILFDSIYTTLGIPATARKNRQKIRDYTATILDRWKAIAYIRGYQLIKKGSAYYSIVVDIDQSTTGEINKRNVGQSLIEQKEKSIEKDLKNHKK